ncbi:MAG: N-acetylmuramoyl-L-alanine amidase [Betaproteobacteria bacterium]|nr:N-acetylmuramoyl-L-alanine amidase [Betaproteobacteria bacterium]
MTVEQHGPLPPTNFMVGRQSVAIDRIVLHTMVAWIGSADRHFHNPAARVSAHFGVRIDGSLWQWVDLADTAYHAGDLSVNSRSIGIEHEDGGDPAAVRPDALYARSAALVAQFAREYGIPIRRGFGGPGIYDHRQIVATACPGELDTDRIICEAREL